MTIKYNKGIRFMKKLLICAILCTLYLVSCTTKSVIEEPIVEQTKVDTVTNLEEQLKEETEEEEVKEEIVTEQAEEIVEEQKEEVSEICVSPGDIEIIGGKTKADWISNRDRLVELEASKYAGGTMVRTVRVERLVSLTRDRCYELLKYYMK